MTEKKRDDKDEAPPTDTTPPDQLPGASNDRAVRNPDTKPDEPERPERPGRPGAPERPDQGPVRPDPDREHVEHHRKP